MTRASMADLPDDDDGECTLVVPGDLSGQRLDKAMAVLCPDHSRSRLKVLIESGDVVLDGRKCNDASHKVAAGQSISFVVPDPVEAVPQPENIPLDIVYEDDDLLVIDKPVGLVVHPGAGNWTGTLVNALLHHCGDSLSGIGGVVRPGIVHRLDKETSGLIIVAKNDRAHRGLSAQLEDRSLSRTYTALVWKQTPVKGVIDKPIARHPTNRVRMHVPFQGGREARTHYHRTQAYGEALSLVDCVLESGRTHQIRVHMQAIGHPLVGDPLYGIQDNAGRSLLRKGGFPPGTVESVMSFPRQALHAREIVFIHPATGAEMGFESPLPADLQDLLALLG